MYVEGESSRRESVRYHGWGWFFCLPLVEGLKLYVGYEMMGEVENARCHIRPGNSISYLEQQKKMEMKIINDEGKNAG
jgi:hypothetical protein